MKANCSLSLHLLELGCNHVTFTALPQKPEICSAGGITAILVLQMLAVTEIQLYHLVPDIIGICISCSD